MEGLIIFTEPNHTPYINTPLVVNSSTGIVEIDDDNEAQDAESDNRTLPGMFYSIFGPPPLCVIQ